MKDEPTEKVMILKDRVIDALRVTKDYDNAIDLDCKLLRSLNLLQREPFEVTASLLISYIEFYRVEKYQSLLPSAKAKNCSAIMGLFNIIPDEYETDDIYKQDFLLAMAQLSYLCHKKDNNEQFERNCLEGAILRVERIALAKWMRRNYCSTCHQRSNAPSQLQLICRDCRVSCYCDIDHQRESWMKNEIKGTRLGHKVFCPVLKAFRIRMQAKDNDDEEREAKMESRFKKECIAFLAYGLGLKDKCFEAKDFAS